MSASNSIHVRRASLPIAAVMALACTLPAVPADAQSSQKGKPSSTAKSAPATRTEHDLLGKKQIPADAYYGVQTARALEVDLEGKTYFFQARLLTGL